MPIMLCASKYHILSHWKEHLGDAVLIARSQKELLDMVASEQQETPVVLLESRLYETKIAQIVSALKEANPASAVMILSPQPTFSEAQEMLALGVNGYGNMYLAKGWLEDAARALQLGENWIFPLQEKGEGVGSAVGEVGHLEGALFGHGGRILNQGDPVYAYEALASTPSTKKISIVFMEGPALYLGGEERLFLDESVFSLTPHTPLASSGEAIKARPSLPVSERPFYVNVGTESLIDADSSELTFKEAAPKYVAMYPFHIEEVVPKNTEGLTFGASVVREGLPMSSMVFQGRIEEYEILYPEGFPECVFVNDTLARRDGARVVYKPVETLVFSNAKIDLFHAATLAPNFNSKQFGDFLNWTGVRAQSLSGVSIEVWNYTQGVDYLLFDRACIPSDVRFAYAMDEKRIGIHFSGVALANVYRTLLETVRHECGSVKTPLHVKVEAHKNQDTWVLYEGIIDT